MVILGVHFSLDSGSSPAAMNCLILADILFAISIGMLWFKEKHSLGEFIGSFIVVIGLICIALQNRLDDIGSIRDMNAFYLAMLSIICSSIMWGIWALSGKYVSLYYKDFMGEYSFVNMIIHYILNLQIYTCFISFINFINSMAN